MVQEEVVTSEIYREMLADFLARITCNRQYIDYAMLLADMYALQKVLEALNRTLEKIEKVIAEVK